MTLRAIAPAIDARRRLARRRAPAAAIVADAVFRVVGVVGMAGTVLVLDVAVVLRALIDIVDQHADRRSGRHLPARRFVHHHAGENARLVRLAALRGEARRSRPPPVEFGLDVGGLERNARRAAVDDAADSRPVALAEGGDAKQMSESVVRHGESAWFIRAALPRVKLVRRPIPATQYSSPIHLEGRMPSPANGQESNNNGECKMMKTLTAIGLSAAIVFAPLAALAQTDAAPAAAAPAAADAAAPGADSMMKKPMKKHMAKKHMAKKMKKPTEDAAPAAPADAPKS